VPHARARRLGSALSALLGLVVFAAIAGVLVAVTVTPAVAVTGIAAKNGLGFFENLPSDLTITPLDQRTQIYAKSHGKNVRIASFYTQNREIVQWDDVAKTVRSAAVAGEDVRFYEHGGVDPTGIARAVVADLLGKNIQGASTITQQYVKNVCVMEAERLPTQKKVLAAYQVCVDPSVGRKVREMRYAIGLEKRYSKDQILLGYLNIAGFGGQIYGIQAAAKYYFDTPAKDLTPAQAASLLAIVNNPERLRLDEPANLAANTARRDYILRTEYAHGMLSAADYRTAVAMTTKPKITPTRSGCSSAGVAGYFCDYVVRTIEQSSAFGKTPGDRIVALQSAGWKIYTTLDLDLQKSAQKTMNRYVPKTSKLLDIGGAAISVEVGTGRIVTMVQNKTFNAAADAGPKYSAVNYNTDESYGGSGGIQPGSTYKVFTLLDWLQKGHTLYQRVNADQRTIPADRFQQCGSPDTVDKPWSVGNDEGRSENGLWSVYDATRKSINGAFATMGEQLDLCDIRKTAEAFDVHPALGGRLSANPSSIIGTNFVSPLSMATAYAGLANDGRTCTPVAILKVVKADGSRIPVPKTSCRQSVDEPIATAAVYALRSVVTGGTAYGDQTPDGIYTFGKTGTTDNAESTWMIGSTSKVTTAVWVGNVQGHVNLRKITSFPYCPTTYSTQAATMRHCVWKGIQTAVNKEYGGAKSWPKPDQRFLAGGAPVAAAPTTPSSSTGSGVVPQVKGMSKQAAIQALLGSSLAWAIGPSEPSSLPAGQIVRTSPAAGTKLAPHTEVTLYPSAG
jgi:membrane peptidoglycan carboxypeptidase